MDFTMEYLGCFVAKWKGALEWWRYSFDLSENHSAQGSTDTLSLGLQLEEQQQQVDGALMVGNLVFSSALQVTFTTYQSIDK